MKLLWKYWGKFVGTNPADGTAHVKAHEFLSFVEKEIKNHNKIN